MEPRESRLIPDPLNANVKVQVQLPPEAQAILNDLHNDRQAIGVGGVIMIVLTAIMAIKMVFGQPSTSK